MLKPNLPTEYVPKSDPEIVRLGTEVRDLLTHAMKSAGKNAKEVAKEMSERLGGRPITGSMIYELTRNGGPGQQREVKLPVTWLAAFCLATGDNGLQRWAAGPQLRELIELGQRVRSMRWVVEEIRKCLDEMNGAQPRKKARRPKGKRRTR